MTRSQLRQTVFLLWVLFWIVSTISLVLAPLLRVDGAINSSMVIPSIISISGIWLPPLSCLAGFWFNTQELDGASQIMATREKFAGSIILTTCYLVFVMVLLLWPVYVVDYESFGPVLPEGAAFDEQLNQSVRIALLVSPLALGPIAWLTGNSSS